MQGAESWQTTPPCILRRVPHTQATQPVPEDSTSPSNPSLAEGLAGPREFRVPTPIMLRPPVKGRNQKSWKIFFFFHPCVRGKSYAIFAESGEGKGGKGGKGSRSCGKYLRRASFPPARGGAR